MKCWLLTFSPEGRSLERKGRNSEKPVPGSIQRDFGCGKIDTLEVIMLVGPWRIMIGLFPEKVMLESFIQSKTTLPSCREIFSLNVKRAGKSQNRSYTP